MPTRLEDDPVPFLAGAGNVDTEAKTLDEDPWAPRV